jgi:hypothetical protein
MAKAKNSPRGRVTPIAQERETIRLGNLKKTITVDSDLGVDEDAAKQREAKRQARLDMRGTDLEVPKKSKAVGKTLRTLAKLEEDKKPASQKRSRAAADLVDYRPMGKNAETAMINRQRQFEKLPAGHPKKEQLRRSIGRTLQTGILSESGGAELKQIACQGEAGCGNSVKVLNGLDFTEANPETGKPAGNGRALDPREGDVVCRDCLRKGDVAGKTYRDRAEQMSSTNTGAGRVGTAQTRRAS